MLFSLVAIALAGTYTPGLVLLAERFPVARRGWAIGWFLAAASSGYALALKKLTRRYSPLFLTFVQAFAGAVFF